jgi:hypothetical protein
VFRATPASAQATSAAPPNFPSSISIYQQAYQNWAGMIVVDNAWTCAPASAADVVTLANWAHANGYRLRAKGMSHNWSPILLPAGSTGAGYVLVDTTQHLTSVSIAAGSPATVTAQAGVTMDALTTALAAAGYGLCAMPAPGDITLGGMLAINAHGSAIPGTGETPLRLTVQPDRVTHRGGLEFRAGAVRAEDVPALGSRHPRLPGPPRPCLHHPGHRAGRGEPDAALPELGRRLGG